MVKELEIPQDTTLEKLLADHMTLKKRLGPNNTLVQALWSEIRKRRNESD